MNESYINRVQSGQPVEATQIVGDMFVRAQAGGLPAPLLAAAWVHLQAYEAGRDRPSR